jgi:HPt (histidine-containing phosphotransfer) domain-containing protein
MPAVDAVPAALRDVPGLEAARGLAAIGGRGAVYRRLLGLFVETHADDGRGLCRLLAEHRGAEAAALAHRLRGAAATLGLVGVEAAVREFEQALDARPGDGAAALAQQAAQQVAQALAELLPRLSAALER